jgi:hypothetical protein
VRRLIVLFACGFSSQFFSSYRMGVKDELEKTERSSPRQTKYTFANSAIAKIAVEYLARGAKYILEDIFFERLQHLG